MIFPDTLQDESLKSLIDALMQPEPSQRLGMQGHGEIKNHPFFANVDWAGIEAQRVPVPASNVIVDPQDPQRIMQFDLSSCAAECPCRHTRARQTLMQTPVKLQGGGESQ